MFAVIFRAKINRLDEEYSLMAQKMRDLAISEYGCKEFSACAEGNNEIAISYWETESQIKEWKKNSKHLVAQELGRSKWYKSYTIQIVEVQREYGSST